jgi:hypothetical protein
LALPNVKDRRRRFPPNLEDGLTHFGDERVDVHERLDVADNAPEAMLSLVANTAVPSGLKPSVAEHLRDSNFPYVVPA